MRFAYKKGEYSATYPDCKKDIGRNIPIEIKQTPGQEEKRNRIGKKMFKTTVY